MIKGNAVHDTIVIVKRDTIVKVVELVSKEPVPKASTFVQWFNDYSNVSVFFGTVATAGALIVAIYAIFKTAKDSRHQLLVGKFEEIYELIVSLSVEYKILYDNYLDVQEETKNCLNVISKDLVVEHIKDNIISLSDSTLEELYQKTIRLNVLSNAYLTKNLKYDVIGYSQLFSSLLHILQSGNIDEKYNEFPENFPPEFKVLEVTEDISMALVDVINLGTPNKGYRNYLNTTFKSKLGLRENK